ncbi:Phosphoenolpyruvate synthase (EC [Olavius algarvensis associated proteobacterium Delta 3]|nr:Phosphoenolpyruvate synthase (EC [Olavius algarvensis associated proteobacterium Delta 3]
MNIAVPIASASAEDRRRIGGKAYALWRMHHAGLTLPETVFVTTDAYAAFITEAGLQERILLELNRKNPDLMRWEEIWDCAARIRHLFLTRPWPSGLKNELLAVVRSRFPGVPVAVRSSALDEDASGTSFAGIHESHIHLTEERSILDGIRKVWASLWSDGALLYRKETGLSVERSAMAVVLQETLAGDASGVVFTVDPADDAKGVIEAVHGLNEGLIDGRIPPDRWRCLRGSREIIEHIPVSRNQWVMPTSAGTVTSPIPEHLKAVPPLNDGHVRELFALAMTLESIWGCPQDVEWTCCDGRFVLLQSRPITTSVDASADDQRGWYLSLHRSFENLQILRKTIETERLPALRREADILSKMDVAALSDPALTDEIRRRADINTRWVDVYWAEFIPFAHGIRLFGQIYNERVKPEDPYEFMRLLGQTPLMSLERNDALEQLATLVREDPVLRQAIEARQDMTPNPLFEEKIDSFINRFGDLSCPMTGGKQCGQGPEALLKIVLELAGHPRQPKAAAEDMEILRQKFFDTFDPMERMEAESLLDLARASYRIRDDDNMLIGRVEAQLIAAVNEARARLKAGVVSEDLQKALHGLHFGGVSSSTGEADPTGMYTVRARQLVGQPAGPGVVRGKARVVADPTEIANFKSGEILVVDAVDPNMTYIVPLAAGIIERRGGMLIHGAIIAREYGLPCVTGIPEATTRIRTGDVITVDGFLGIVTLSGDRDTEPD